MGIFIELPASGLEMASRSVRIEGVKLGIGRLKLTIKMAQRELAGPNGVEGRWRKEGLTERALQKHANYCDWLEEVATDRDSIVAGSRSPVFRT